MKDLSNMQKEHSIELTQMEMVQLIIKSYNNC